jgi:preprotein translocase subunit SecE
LPYLWGEFGAFGLPVHERSKKSDMAKTNPFEFLQQVRAETAKVTWPTRNETIVTTIMVLIMAILAALFFFLADQVLSWGVGTLLGLTR